MSWPDVRIAGALGWLTVAVVLGAVAAVVWGVFAWIHAGVVASLERRLAAAEQGQRSFARVFHGQTMEEAAARLETLERLVSELPPRMLNDDQRGRLAKIGAPPWNASYLGVVYDSGFIEVRAYAHDFVEVLAKAPGWNVVDAPYARMQKLDKGAAVGLADPERPTPTELLVLTALKDAGVEFGIVQRTAPGMHAQIIISAR